MTDSEKLEKIIKMVDTWMDTAGPGTETERIMGRQVVSVGFLYDEVHAITD